MTSNIERRVLTAANVSSSDPHSVNGYAARYNSKTNMWEFWEQISPGAFKSSIARNDDIRLLRDHNPSLLLARTKSGTMKVTENVNGLYFTASLPETECGRDTLELIKRGDLSGCSFSFAVGEDSWTDTVDDNGKPCLLRTIRDFSNVYDCSICCYPAYASTSVDARSIVPEKVLAEARSAARRAGKMTVVHNNVARYVRMTDAEVAAAAESERGLKGMHIGETPYGWQR